MGWKHLLCRKGEQLQEELTHIKTVTRTLCHTVTWDQTWAASFQTQDWLCQGCFTEARNIYRTRPGLHKHHSNADLHQLYVATGNHTQLKKSNDTVKEVHLLVASHVAPWQLAALGLCLEMLKKKAKSHSMTDYMYLDFSVRQKASFHPHS